MTKRYKHLQDLQSPSLQDEDLIEVREFVKIMLELKHECIIDEFANIYNKIVEMLHLVKFSQVEKEEERQSWLEKHRTILVNHIKEN